MKRLQLVRRVGESPLNWLFLPGGPGLGSESLLPLIDILELPGAIWRLDLPGDGSNRMPSYGSFSSWFVALIEAVGELEPVVLVAHSTGGMYALSCPELEELLEGLVLLDSAPDTGWQSAFAEAVENIVIPEIARLQQNHAAAPSDETLRALTVASAPYLFTEKGMASGTKMLRSLPYNYAACRFSEEHFDGVYSAKWIPREIPTLILNGEHDLITPQRLFAEKKEWHRGNIAFQEISGGGHFPWIENPKDVEASFAEFSERVGDE